VFPARAQLQMVVSAVLLAGEGEREAARRKLREKLQAEGLFALERKRALPRVPRVVGLATSKNGAAFGDVVRVARGRFPVTLLLANCKVQGPDAPGSIARAIEALAQRPEMDVIIVARGGGASEDLSAFDEEEVVRAIAGCRVPIVTGVGHEVDVTLADLAADVRGATPSNAAERAVPDGQALRHELTSATRRLQQAFDAKVRGARLRLAQLASRVTGRRALLRARKDELARLERTIERAMRRRIEHARRQRGGLDARLAASDPRRALARTRTSLDRLTPRLGVQMRARLAAARRALADVRASLDQGMRDALVHERSAHGGLDARLLRVLAPSLASRRAALALLAGRLDALSPLAVLGRGYAIALDARTGKALTRAADVAPGDRLHVRLERGAIEARVESVTPAEDES
jgi:exodeoxyribonuclease VII large subunit